jgi:hypothetical protein
VRNDPLFLFEKTDGLNDGRLSVVRGFWWAPDFYLEKEGEFARATIDDVTRARAVVA